MALPPVYSTRFLSVHGVGPVAEYTVPSGFVAILRDLDAFKTGTDESAVADMVNASAGVAIWLGHFSGTASWISWRGRQVIPAGETVEVSATGTTDVSITVSGYLLST